MADKGNNNLEDIKYTEDIEDTEDNQVYSYDTQDDSDNEYQEENDSEEYEEDDYEENEDGYEKPASKKINQMVIILIFIILILLLAFIIIPRVTSDKSTNQGVNNDNNFTVTNTEQNSYNSEDNLADSFFDAAGGENTEMMSVNFNDNGEVNVEVSDDNNVATVTDADAADVAAIEDLFENNNNSANDEYSENNPIMVVYNKAARTNPFKPPVSNASKSIPHETINDTEFEIIEPPTRSIPDENLTRLLQTQISGILYDSESPSAIVNLNGIDQFVKVGDVISGYKIANITKDKVQIDYKSNSYVASVGQLFTRGSLEKKAAIVNIENKFAGRNKNNNLEE